MKHLDQRKGFVRKRRNRSWCRQDIAERASIGSGDSLSINRGGAGFFSLPFIFCFVDVSATEPLNERYGRNAIAIDTEVEDASMVNPDGNQTFRRRITSLTVFSKCMMAAASHLYGAET